MPGEKEGSTQQPAEQTPQQIAADEARVEEAMAELVVADDEGNSVAKPDPETDPETDQADEGADEEESDDSEDSEGSEDEDQDDEDNEDEEDADQDDDENDGDEKADKLSRHQKRINKLTAQRAELRERAETAEARVQELEARASDSVELHSDYLTKDELSQIRQANTLMAREEFLLRWVGRGYEDPNDESKNLTPDQISDELIQIRRQSDQVSDAQKIYRERKKLQTEDMKAGRAMRLSKKALNKDKPGNKPKVKSNKGTASAPRKPKPDANRGPSFDRFQKNGGDEAAAEKELENFVV